MGHMISGPWRSAACVVYFLLCGFCEGQKVSTDPGQPVLPTPTQTASAQTSPASLPNAPAPPAAQSDEVQPKRIMGLMPNFRTVSAGEKVPEEDFRGKFWTSTQDNFDYTSLFFAGIIAADSFATKATPEFHQGAARLCAVLLAHGG